MPRYIVLPVDTEWGIWDTLAEKWASFFAQTPEELTYVMQVDAEAQAEWMNTQVGLN